MYPMLIGLTGKQRSGKDTVAAILTRLTGAPQLVIADRLRSMALDLNPLIPGLGGYDNTPPQRLATVVEHEGWEAAKSRPEVRRTLQAIGRAVRTQWPTLLINSLEQDIQDVSRTTKAGVPVVVSDVKMPHEAELIQSLGGVVVRVLRPDHLRTGATNSADITETGLDTWLLPTIINDSDLQTLERRTVGLLTNIR